MGTRLGELTEADDKGKCILELARGLDFSFTERLELFHHSRLKTSHSDLFHGAQYLRGHFDPVLDCFEP